MKTLREIAKETIENYTDEYLNSLISSGNFIGIDPDGYMREIDYYIFPDGEGDADDMREALNDFLDSLEEGFFNDEDGDSLMADIVNNDVLWEWGADATLLESYSQKMQLLQYISNYGVIGSTKTDTNEYDWDIMTCRLDLNRRFDGTIYRTCKWNSENMTFCIGWDCEKDALQAGAIDLNELDELKEEIEDGNVVFWSEEKGTITGAAAKEAALEWLESHDVTERMKRSCSPEYWKKLTEKLRLPENYDEYIYYTDNGCSRKREDIALITIQPDKQ